MKIILKNTKLEFQAGTFDVALFVEGGQEGIWNPESAIDNPEWADVIVDSEEKILWGRYHNYPATPDYTPDLSNDYIEGVSVQKIVNALVNEL